MAKPEENNMEKIMASEVYNEDAIASGVHFDDVTIINTTITVDNPYNGEKINQMLIHGLEDFTEAQVLEILEDKLHIPVKGTYCQHEHDCCGCYYANSIDLHKAGKIWLAVQGWSQNV